MRLMYRDHRTSLSDSLETAKEFSSIKEIIEYLSSQFAGFYSKLSIKIEYYGYDDRVRQDLFMVRADGHGVFGFLYYEDNSIQSL